MKNKKFLLGLTALCVAFTCACNLPLFGTSEEESSSVSIADSSLEASSVAESSVEEVSSKEESSVEETTSEEVSSEEESSEEASSEEESSEEESSEEESSVEEESSSEETSEEEVHTHTLTYIEANDGDCQTDGNIAYYTCEGCGKYFADEDAENVLTETDIVIKASHTLTYHEETKPSGKTNGSIAYYDCGACGKYYADVNGLNELTAEELVVLSVYNIPDFVVEVESGKDPVVLQLSDPQLCNWGNVETYCYQYIREAINETKPDLIIITGDLVYGRFDPNGTLLQGLISFMEGFQIPWAPVFGNHDNESLMGVDWQCQQLEAAEYCLFKQGDLTGNGNYSVGLAQNEELLRVFYMMDSNGCSKPMCDSNGNQTAPAKGTNVVKTSAGFGQDQIDWYTKEINAIHALDADVKISFAYHIQQQIFQKAFEKYSEYDSTAVSSTLVNPLNLDTLATAEETDFGYVGRVMKGAWDTNYAIFNGMKALGVDSIFVGHEHCNSSSIVYQGVRFQYSQKSSKYDRYNSVTEDGTITGGYDADHPVDAHLLMGGTVIPVASDGSIGTGYIYYAGNPFYFEPKPVEMPVNGLKLDASMLQSGMGMTILGKAYDDTVNAYEIYSESQGKIFFDTTLAAQYNYFTFTVLVPVDSANTGSTEFFLRVKPDNNLEGSDGRYIYYTKSQITRGEWKTFTVDISSVDETCTEFSLMFASLSTTWLRDIAFTNEQGYVPEEPNKIAVNGIELTTSMLQAGKVMTVEALAYDENVNAYKITSGSASAKIYFDTKLAAQYDTFTFSALVDVNSGITSGSVEFYLRVKPDGSLTSEQGSDGKYIYYQSTTSNVLRSVTRGEWKTFTVDISGLDSTCTEFAFMFDAGAIVWFKDVAFTNTPEVLKVNGLQYGGVVGTSELWLQTDKEANRGGTIVVESFTNADGTKENVYKVTAGEGYYEKLHINPELLKGKTTVTLSVLVTEEATGTDGGCAEYAIRIKPNPSADVIQSISNGYLYFDVDMGDYRKVTLGEWKTITIDISAFANECTEYSVYIFGGNTIYVKDITIS